MAFETPLLVVSRPVAACSRCKTAKTKCDGKLPACTACEKAGKSSECSSRKDDEFARGRERSYVATLEARIDKLKYRLAQAGRHEHLAALQHPPSGASSRPSSVHGDHVSPPPTAAAAQAHHPRVARRKEADDIEGLVSNFGVLSVNAAARDFHGFTSTMSYSRMILAAAAAAALPADIPDAALVPRHEMVQLANHYFQGVYLFLPIFEDVVFWRAVDQVYSHAANTSPMDHWMVHMVAAVSIISKSTKFLDPAHQQALAHLKVALRWAEHVLNPGTIPSVQAMLLLLEYARYDPIHFSDWTLMGAISRAMADLGLHQDPPKSNGSSAKSRLLLRRRVFYCIYCLDRATSICYDRAFSFNDQSHNVSFPSQPIPQSKYPPSPDFGASSKNKQVSDGLQALVQLRHIQSTAYQDLHQSGRDEWSDPYPYIWQKWHELAEWRHSVAATLSPWAAFLANAEQLSTNIFLLAPSPRVPNIEELAQSLIFEHGVEYVDNLTRAIKEPACSAWISYTEALRARKVGRIFVRNLSTYRSRLLSGVLPNVRSSLHHNSLTPPPFPYPPRTNNLDRALGFIYAMTQVLDTYSTRFGTNDLLVDFERETHDLVIELSSQSPADWRGSFSFANYIPHQPIY